VHHLHHGAVHSAAVSARIGEGRAVRPSPDHLLSSSIVSNVRW
jgi:hypothetical protein